MNWVHQNWNGWIDYFRFIQFNTIYHGGIWKKKFKTIALNGILVTHNSIGRKCMQVNFALFYLESENVSCSVKWLCEPVDCSPPGSSVHGICQTRILEWVAIPFSRTSFWRRDWTQVSCFAGRFFTIWATRESWGAK